MICPACGTWNREDARFCKHCGAALSPAARPAAPAPAMAAPPPAVVPRPPRAAPWWHGLGVFAILAAFFLGVDLSATGHVTWSLVVILSVAFIVGGVMILQHLASPVRAERRPLAAGAVLLAASVLLLPVALVLESPPTVVETYTLPLEAGVHALHLAVTDDVGRIAVTFARDAPYLARADVVHLGGVFSSHFPGDLVVSNATSGGVATFTLVTRGTSGLYFFGGHDITVTVNASVRVTMALASATGSIAVDVPSGVRIAASAPDGGASVQATVTTGSISLATSDAAFEAGARLEATSTTGSVTIRVAQAEPYAGTVSVRGTSTTGGVAFAFTPGAGVAAHATSATSTGAVHYDPAKYAGLSANDLYAPSADAYAAATMAFAVELASTTGNIDLG